MTLILFIISCIVLFILSTPIIFKIKNTWVVYFIIAFISFIVSKNGTKHTCEDGWHSSNIGTQGACSHHGGVVSKLNDFGILFIFVSIITAIIFLLIYTIVEHIKNKKDKKINS